MSALVNFAFDDRLVRVIDVSGAPWFVAKDVCAALGIANDKDAVSRLDDDEKSGVGLTDPHGREQFTNIVSEAGLYTIILRSRAAMTPGTVQHRFRKWVTGEVLPALRRTGHYEHTPAPAPSGYDHGLTLPGPTEELRTALKLVATARMLFGRAAAIALWRRVGLPDPDGAGVFAAVDPSLDDDPMLAEWFADRVIADPAARAFTGDLYDDYARWSADREAAARSMPAFAAFLDSRGVRSRKSNRIQRLSVRLRTASD